MIRISCRKNGAFVDTDSACIHFSLICIDEIINARTKHVHKISLGYAGRDAYAIIFFHHTNIQTSVLDFYDTVSDTLCAGHETSATGSHEYSIVSDTLDTGQASYWVV